MGILAAEPAKLENHLVLHIPSCWLLLLEPQKCALLQRQWSLGRLHHTNRVEPLVLEIAREIAACARPRAQKYPDRPVYSHLFILLMALWLRYFGSGACLDPFDPHEVQTHQHVLLSLRSLAAASIPK